jgi:hypothetical protein
MRKSRPYRDRRLAVTPHAVDRLRERTGATHLDDDACRWIIADAALPAIEAGTEESHYVLGQSRVRVDLFGLDVYAVIGRDDTGWSTDGLAVVTILTPAQVRESERGGFKNTARRT